MKGLRPSQNGRQGLHGGADDIVVRLLGGKRTPRSLGVETEHPGPRILGLETLPHDFGPDPPGGSVFGDLLKKIDMGVEKKGKAAGKIVHLETSFDAGLDIADPVCQRKSQLLHRRGAGLPNVVAADADGVPSGDLLGTILHGIHDQPDGGARGKHERLLGDELLEHVVLDRAPDLLPTDPLLFRYGDVHGQKNRRRGVDGHGGGHFVQGDSLKKDFHVLQRVNGHPALPHLAPGPGTVGVVSHERGVVKSHGEAGLPLGQEVFIPPVGVLRAPETGEHPHGPEPSPVHGGLNPAGVGKLTGEPDISHEIKPGNIFRGVQFLDLQVGDRGKPPQPFRALDQGRLITVLLPGFFGLDDRLEFMLPHVFLRSADCSFPPRFVRCAGHRAFSSFRIPLPAGSPGPPWHSLESPPARRRLWGNHLRSEPRRIPLPRKPM